LRRAPRRARDPETAEMLALSAARDRLTAIEGDGELYTPRSL
jgi:hypothetical protein